MNAPGNRRPAASYAGPPARWLAAPPLRRPSGPPARQPAAAPPLRPAGLPVRRAASPPPRRPAASSAFRPAGPPARQPAGPPPRRFACLLDRRPAAPPPRRFAGLLTVIQVCEATPFLQESYVRTVHRTYGVLRSPFLKLNSIILPKQDEQDSACFLERIPRFVLLAGLRAFLIGNLLIPNKHLNLNPRF